MTNLRSVHHKEILSRKTLKKLCKLLLKNHTPLTIDILSIYQIPYKDIITGVQCPECHFIPLKKSRNGWPCPSCKMISKDAHIQAVEDYFLLISPTITNKQCKDFLNLNSHDTAYRILTSMNLPHNGKTKGRVYFNPPK
jgi:ssDNA-binding Zn-finger/Zn-ribbon topoisomerase 1